MSKFFTYLTGDFFSLTQWHTTPDLLYTLGGDQIRAGVGATSPFENVTPIVFVI